MTKTIEEAARNYAKDKVGDYDYLGVEYEAYLDGNEDAVKWVMSLPLASRLTAAEKERVRKMYWQAAMDWVGVYDVLEEIFGHEFFREGEV